MVNSQRRSFGNSGALNAPVVSICDQLSKIVVTGREFDITDIPFDVMGYLIGILLVYVARHEWHKFKQR